jgi:ABC-type Mn2+/Zn2+ transport system ATPase subunit
MIEQVALLYEQRTQHYTIAGPNGAGKTTFVRVFLPHEANCPDYSNAVLNVVKLRAQ